MSKPVIQRVATTEYITYPARYNPGKDSFYPYKNLRAAQARARKLGAGAQIWRMEETTWENRPWTSTVIIPAIRLSRTGAWKRITSVQQ